jgi:hypothetical protein
MPENAATDHRRAMRCGILTLTLLSPALVGSHDEVDHCTAVKASFEEAGFADQGTVTCEGDVALIKSATYPDHPLMTGIVGTNEQVPVPAKDYAAPVSLVTHWGPTPQTHDRQRGV